MSFTRAINMLYYIGNHETWRQYESRRSCKEHIQQQSWNNSKTDTIKHTYRWYYVYSTHRWTSSPLTRNRLGGIMIGRLVRYTYTNQIGIVLRRKVTRRAIFRYDVLIDGKVLSILPQMLEVIDG
jgi:hypothetical protein